MTKGAAAPRSRSCPIPSIFKIRFEFSYDRAVAEAARAGSYLNSGAAPSADPRRAHADEAAGVLYYEGGIASFVADLERSNKTP